MWKSLFWWYVCQLKETEFQRCRSGVDEAHMSGQREVCWLILQFSRQCWPQLLLKRCQLSSSFSLFPSPEPVPQESCLCLPSRAGPLMGIILGNSCNPTSTMDSFCRRFFPLPWGLSSGDISSFLREDQKTRLSSGFSQPKSIRKSCLQGLPSGTSGYRRYRRPGSERDQDFVLVTHPWVFKAWRQWKVRGAGVFQKDRWGVTGEREMSD